MQVAEYEIGGAEADWAPAHSAVGYHVCVWAEGFGEGGGGVAAGAV